MYMYKSTSRYMLLICRTTLHQNTLVYSLKPVNTPASPGFKFLRPLYELTNLHEPRFGHARGAGSLPTEAPCINKQLPRRCTPKGITGARAFNAFGNPAPEALESPSHSTPAVRGSDFQGLGLRVFRLFGCRTRVLWHPKRQMHLRECLSLLSPRRSDRWLISRIALRIECCSVHLKMT